MLPLVIPDLLERIIVTVVISIATAVILRILFKSRKSKSGGCNKCDPDQ
jgi:hypothetical protein